MDKRLQLLYKSQFKTAFIELLNKAQGMLDISDIDSIVNETMIDYKTLGGSYAECVCETK